MSVKQCIYYPVMSRAGSVRGMGWDGAGWIKTAYTPMWHRLLATKMNVDSTKRVLDASWHSLLV